MSSSLDLTGRVAVVIGATSGLGRAIAIGLAQNGADVVASGRRQGCAEEVASEIRALGRKAVAAPCDVADRTSLETLRDGALAEFGHVDVLVNAAGYTFRKPTNDVTDSDWSDLFDTNLNGTLRACQTFYASLKTSGHGRIINIASLSSYLAFHEVAAYCASKTAVS